MATDYGYLIPKDNYGKSSNADRYKKIAQQASLPKQTTTEKKDSLWVESTAPNALQKQNINATVKPLNMSTFVKDVKDTAEQNRLKVEEDIAKAGYKTNDFTEEEKNQLISGKYRLNPSYNPNDKFSKKLIYSGTADIKSYPTLGQRVANTAEKAGRTTMDLIGNAATGVTQGFEGYVDAAVGVGGTALSGVANLVGKKELAQNIKNKAEEIAGYGFAKNMQELVDEKSKQGEGIYNPSILGVMDVRDAAREIARMYTVGRTGGMPGFMISAAGGNIEEALNEGESLGRATAYGALSGSLEGIVEKMFDPAKILGGGLKTIGKGFLGKIAEATVGEGAEEGITAALNPFVKMLTYEGGVENPFGSWDNFKNYLRDIGQSVYQGAIIGGLTLGVSAPGNVDLQKSFSNDVYKAVEKIQGVDQIKKNEIANTILEGAKSVTGEEVKNIRQYAENYRNNSQASQYIPKNSNLTIQRENVTGLPKLNSQNQAQNSSIEQTNVTLPTRTKTAQNANMEQITQTPNLPTQKAQQTLQSAKIAGMTDMDIQKAKELNDMLRSGTRLNFYDEKTIPQNVQADKAKIANGFYKDGTLWINKNSKNKVEQILGHELTHHLETTDSYTDLSNTILDSEVFYDFIAEKGYANVAEYKTKLKEMGYNDAQLDNELVARFVEEKMFTDQKSIDRLARQNTKLVEKIKNWISDLVVSFKGTVQEKELRRIENMYRKALEQARNSTATAETQYSIAGIKGAKRLSKNPAYKNIIEQYNNAKQLFKQGYDNARLIEETGWYRDNKGNWKYEFSDEDMTLKENIKLDNKKIYPLDKMLQHDVLFEAYPQLRNYTVVFANIGDGHKAGIFAPAKIILLNPKYANTKANVEYELVHEIQHAIQVIEGFPGAATNKNGKYAYYTSLGEIEARDVSERLRMLQEERKQYMPESAKENPTHEGLQRYLDNRKEGDRLKDEEYIRKQEARDNLKESIKNFFGGRIGYAQDIEVDNSEYNTETQPKADGILRNENIENKRVAGKEPAFSMPETDNQGRTLSKEQQEFFKDSKVRDEEGKLIPVYHGTKADFNVFAQSEGGALGKGIYFAESYDYAKGFGRNGKVVEAYVNIKNPYVVSWPGNYNQEELKTKGYDGIYHTGNKFWVAFEPNQIKNIDNTNPTSNPDIRYSMNQIKGGKKPTSTKALSTYAQTLQSKHQDIPEQVNLIQKEVDNGNFMHEVVHDKRALNYAQKYIEENGFEDAVNHWDELIKRGKPVDKDELALGQTIYNIAVDNKDTRLVMKMASDLVQEYTEIGRNLQSATLLRKMTPDGKLYALERSVQKINQDLMQKFDDFENIKIPEELADKLLRSETKTDMDKAVEQIQEYIASKIPATWQEKLNSWRYLAMLGNPRTHIRNIVGNAVFIPAVEVKNALAQVGELAISKDQRTKAIVTSLSKNDAKLLKYAENDFDNNRETIRGENKYDIKAGVQEKRTIYSWKAIEAARRGNFNLLEAEDTLFLKYRYKKAFAGALKARGITIEQLRENSPETVKKVSEIRNYAINEAQKATYRDASKVAAMVSRGKRKLLNAANQSTGAARLGYNLAYLGAEGVMPFAKTPINIVKRGLEYSPAGLLNGIKDAALNVKNGKKTAAQAIDEIAAGATGTAIAAFGLFLASQGLVSGGEEEKDKEQALKELKGNQNYSFNAFGKSYTIDWTAPSSIPLFIGVELYNSIASEDESAYLNALSNLVEPVVEMSMLQGINDTLKTMGEENAIGNIISKTLMNYLGQYNPTLLGQIARSADPLRRTTYVDKNIPIPAAAQRFIQQQAAKIPGVSRMLPTYKDQFGQEQLTDGVLNRIAQNFFSPGYLKDIKEGTVEQGLTELYEKTGETSVIPSYASKTLTHNGEKINLTAKQYDTYAKTRGELSKKGLEGLFKDNYYKNLSDEQKVKVVEAIYDYAGKIAKTKVIDDYELEFNDKKIQKLQSEGLDFYKYILLKKTADADGNDYTSNDELDKAIKKYGLTRWQKTIKEKNTKTTKTTNTLPTLSQQRAKLPTLKK